MSKKMFGLRKSFLAVILKLHFFPQEKVLKKIIFYRIMCTFLQKLLKLDVFHHFRTLSDDFFVVSIKKLRRNIFEERNLICWAFSAFKRKIPTFSAISFGLGYHNCLQPIHMKFLRFFSRKYSSFLSFLEHDGKSLGLSGKKFWRGRNVSAF